MNPELLNTLVHKKIIMPGTEVEVKYLAPGLDGWFREEVKGIFTVGKIVLEEESNKVKHLLCVREADGAKLRAISPNIIRVDGMEPSELGKAFDILPNGKMKKVKLDEFGNPVKRGRKPKHLRQGTGNDGNNRPKKLSCKKTTKQNTRTGSRTTTITEKSRGRKPQNRAAC